LRKVHPFLNFPDSQLLTGMNSGGAVCVGGPALVRYVQPTDEELFQKYNPELQKRSLERRYEREKDFDDFVVKLKQQAKSDKPSEFSYREPSAVL